MGHAAPTGQLHPVGAPVTKPTKPPVNTHFIHGPRPEELCDICALPCGFTACGETCHRRHFLQGMLYCSYFFRGYCFLIDVPGCAFDNGGRTEEYWRGLLRDYVYNVTGRDEDETFQRARAQAIRYLEEQIEQKNVFLCRYFEEQYSQVLQSGGSASEEELMHLDRAYEALMSGGKRKP
jgi:hypothetical protein